MPLSQADKDRIVEEEMLRFEARAKIREKPGIKSLSCGTCGQRDPCRACRVWGLVFGVIVLLCLFCCLDKDGGRRHQGQRLEAFGADGPGQGPAKVPLK